MAADTGAGEVDREVVGVVLAAGSSRRLGRPKQTLPLGDTTVLGWTLRNVERSALDQVVLVLGAGADAIRGTLHPTRATVVVNEDHRAGPLTSLHAGLDAVGAGAATMVLLGDMPGVDVPVIDRVLGAWGRDPSWAALTRYRDRPGHPLLLSAEARPTVRALRGDKAVWRLLNDAPGSRVRRIGVDRACPTDVDTWQDYARAATELGVAVGPGPDEDGR